MEHDMCDIHATLFENENERQKTEPVPIQLPKAARNFPNVKTRNKNILGPVHTALTQRDK